jgi:hypothetical protein
MARQYLISLKEISKAFYTQNEHGIAMAKVSAGLSVLKQLPQPFNSMPLAVETLCRKCWPALLPRPPTQPPWSVPPSTP